MDGEVGEHFVQPGSQTADWVTPLITTAICPEFSLNVVHCVGPVHVSQLSAQGKHEESDK